MFTFNYISNISDIGCLMNTDLSIFNFFGRIQMSKLTSTRIQIRIRMRIKFQIQIRIRILADLLHIHSVYTPTYLIYDLKYENKQFVKWIQESCKFITYMFIYFTNINY